MKAESGPGDESRGPGHGAAVEGIVRAQLPSGLYEVVVDGRHRMTAHIAEGIGRNFVRVFVGDRVVIEPSPRDQTRGRIVRKA